ncbi:uncharacterized protein MONOS_11761 [Monocercomonoides exilis]|uniref:uncharacterized protein n=1 Tax=Monocercomonoides exilis TaxID=2049356 RepID=UPI00355A4666|nr:hypothetical protein MONOS_11761 [Monocercomonoides exilis]|eukprot:MONOS_11761.1-p1 / transcript=MONOS_11761.1 / gene=MONOS_11761 / organism=Monocercomonoides_exilis_PA203 / gene_product=unspecified product / transcript_product=unspecified product / location=Mono_scaffold00608:27978-28346(+) / protein_length=82 / sequence_SO=supercontig / SO=protein_coding / is_pseudo=false
MCMEMIMPKTEKTHLHIYHNVYNLRRPSSEIHDVFCGDAFHAVFDHSETEMERLNFWNDDGCGNEAVWQKTVEGQAGGGKE